MAGDVRVVANVGNGKNQTYDEQNMWLAPFKNTRSYSAASNQTKSPEQGQLESRIPNYLCFVFDEPQAVSAVRIWNYAKTPSRGVNEFEIVVDDKQIYRGFARQAPEKSEYDRAPHDFSSVVLFTSEDKIVERFKHSVYYDPSKKQSVTLVNEKKIVSAL